MQYMISHISGVPLKCFGPSGLYFIPPNTTMNGPMYVELLKEKLKLPMDIHKCTIFMKDVALVTDPR